MLVCDLCPHCGTRQDKKCTFSGCIVNTYNLHGTGTLEAFMNPKVEEAVEEPVAAEVVEEVVVNPNFNPFQRGNGCMMADMTQKVR